MSEYNDRISEFLQSYIKFPKYFFTESGNLTEEGIKSGVIFLLKGHVFNSKEEIQEEASKNNDYVSDNRFVVVTKNGSNIIYADKDTGIMYFFHKSYDAGEMSVMLDKDGKSLIWKGKQ